MTDTTEPVTHYSVYATERALTGDIHGTLACGAYHWGFVSDDPALVTCEPCKVAIVQPVTSPDIPPQAIAKPACEHYWAFHCYDGLSVRLCQLCHEPDWEDVRRQLAAAVADERERCAQLADGLNAEYALYEGIGLHRHVKAWRPFAALLREQP